MTLPRDAETIACRWHGDQTDKLGEPYTGHLERAARLVAQSGGTEHQVAAAWLHDTVEDTACTPEDLLAEGMPRAVIDMVVTLTHSPEQSNQGYWAQVRANPNARLVKLCDIYDNLDPRRLARLAPQEADQLRAKYGAALMALGDRGPSDRRD